MLKILRKRLKLILWTLILSFVLWMVADYLAQRQSGSIYAGTLFGRPITFQEYRAAWEAVRHRALLTYGERALEWLTPAELEHQAWDHLLLSRAARRAGIRVADREVVEELARWPLFQRDGRFDPRIYQLILQHPLQTTPRAFEEEIRGQLAMTKLMDQVTRTLTASEQELEAAYRAEAEQARLAYLIVEPSAFTGQVMVSDSQIRAYYEAHAGEFQSPLKIAIRYLAVTPQPADEAAVSEADVLEEYLRQSPPAERGTMPTPERQQELRQQVAIARGRDRAADLAWELKAGWSQTPDLAVLGQPHGLRPQEPPPFAREGTISGIVSSHLVVPIAFTLQPGELSRVIETPEAFYLVTQLRRHPAQPQPLAEATPAIRQRLLDQETRALAREQAQNLFATIQELALVKTEDPLASAAKDAGLEVARTELVKRDTVPFLTSAFTLEVGAVGGPWETSRGFVIAHLLERQPIDPEQFAQAKERLRTQVLERKRATALQAWLTQLRQEAKPTPTNPVTGS